MNAHSQRVWILLVGSMLTVTTARTIAADPAAASAVQSSAPPVATATPPCEACHGAYGEGMEAAHVPRIAGQSAEYLQKQLDDYASGARDNPIMSNFAKALSEPQRAKFATRYAVMTAPHVATAQPAGAAQLTRGHQLAYQGDETRRVQSCNACHGPDGVGVAHAAPYLAGQSAEYLASALKAFKEGTRKNDAGELMRSVAARLSEADIDAVSGYFESIHIDP
jgi:cytochrome c553